jgi:hypothetical protein
MAEQKCPAQTCPDSSVGPPLRPHICAGSKLTVQVADW